MYKPSELDQLITFYRPLVKDDGYGGRQVQRQRLRQAWAKVKPHSGDEQKQYDRLNDLARYRFIVRQSSHQQKQFVETDVIEWQGDFYNIRFIERLNPRHLYVQIVAERGNTQ